MKVYINRKPVDGPWGGGNNFVKGMYSYLPKMGYIIVDNPFIDNPDVIFLQSPKPDSISRFSINDAINIKNRLPSTKIVIRVNDCDARKATSGVDDMWIQTSKFADKTVFVSNWMQDYFLKKGWHCKNNHVVYNGVNFEQFKESEKIKNGKINIVAHHWSNNRLKGFDIYEALDNYIATNNNITFTYIGRELGTFKNTKVIDPLFGSALGEELSRYDIYISASKADPGPNHILESLACNIPTYVHKEGGGCVEFAGKDHTFSTLDDFLRIVNSNSVKQNNEIKVQDWKICIQKYAKLLSDV